jgi:hypothetical protein
MTANGCVISRCYIVRRCKRKLNPTQEGKDSRVRINERSHALSPLPSHSEAHIQTLIQRAKGEHTTGKYTGAHASRHAHSRPRGRVATQAQFIRMERRHIIYSSQHPPTTKRGVGNIICKAHPFGRSQFVMGPMGSILETYLGQSTNLKLNLKLKIACKHMGTRAAPPH